MKNFLKFKKNPKSNKIFQLYIKWLNYLIRKYDNYTYIRIKLNTIKKIFFIFSNWLWFHTKFLWALPLFSLTKVPHYIFVNHFSRIITKWTFPFKSKKLWVEENQYFILNTLLYLIYIYYFILNLFLKSL